MAAFVIGQIASLARYMIVTRAFGASAELDAFLSANRVAETLFTLVAGGALGSAFIPTFTGFLVREEHRQAWKLASAICNLVVLVLTVLSALAAIFAPQVVRYALATGFAGDPAQLELTVRLMRLMLPSAVIFGLSGLVMGILNSHRVFLAPALTPAMYQIGQILGVWLLAPSLGIFGLAWGVLIGAGLHLVLQLPALLRQRGAYYPTLGLDTPAVRDVVRLMGPRLVGAAVVQLNFWVNVNLASRMPAGSVAAISLAFALMYMPLAAIAQSIATAALPTFAAQVARGRIDEMRSSLATLLRWVLLLAVPATVGLILLRRPLVAALYQRGEFTADHTDLVAWALLWYAAGLVGHSLVEVLVRAFYSLHDTKTPVMVGAAAMTINLVLSILFALLFTRLGWMPHGGLALANSLATALEMVGLLVLMRRRLSGLAGKEVLLGLGPLLLATLGMGLAVWFWLGLTQGQSVWLVAGGGVALGGLVYGLAVLALGIPEARQAVGLVLGRLRR